VGDRWVVAAAVATWIGASVASPVPRGIGVAVLVLAFVIRWPVLVLLGAALLASSLGDAAHDGLTPAPEGLLNGDVVLVGDPVPVRGAGVRVDARFDGRRYELTAHGRAARALRDRASGDVVHVEGRVQPRPRTAPWLEVRHVVGRVRVAEVGEWHSGSPASRVANSARALLARGARALPPDERALYTGLVFGDDRAQPPELVDDLRAAGLGHLLAVSGQNVAVLVGAARPVLERFRYRVRFPATLALLGLLVLVTRAEPSVLRATVMAGLVALSDALGRSRSPLRVLALAVAVLVLVDPLLVRSVGFQLSVAATAGIVVLSAPIEARLRLAGPLRTLLAVTLAAQLAVAPIVVRTFGGVPVAALPANVLAAPAAAPVMVWGATGGVVAGAVGGGVATALQLPTRVLLAWIRAVSATAGRLPLGELGAAHLAVLAVAGCVVLAERAPRRGRAVALVVVAAVLAQPALALRHAQHDGTVVATGVSLWQVSGASVVVVEGSADPTDALEALRRAGVRRLDLVVATNGGATTAEVVRALGSRYPIGARWAPTGHRVRGARVPAVGATARAGPFEVRVDANEPRLAVTVRRVR
jgi:competence protein ComEC